MKHVRCQHYIILIISMLLVSCGYKMVAPLDIPPQYRTLTIAPFYPREAFYLQLKHHLEGYGFNIQKEGHTNTLHIKNLQLKQRPVAYGSDGQVHRVRIDLTVSFCLKDMHGNILINERRIHMVKDHTTNPNDRLSSNAEREVIINELYQSAVRRLINQLNLLSDES